MTREERYKRFEEYLKATPAERRKFDMSFLNDYSEDLEREISRYQREDMDRDTTVRDVARHFAKWQKEQMMKGGGGLQDCE